MPDPTHPDTILFANARFVAKAGREDDLRRRLQALAVASRRESGNVSYDLFRSKDQPSIFYVQESWRDEAALAAHIGQSYVQAFLSEGQEFQAEPHAVGFGYRVSDDDGR